MRCKCMSVQNVIDALQKVVDKTKPCCVWINSCDPEVTYEGGARIPVVYVDDLENFGVTDICCEETIDTEHDAFCKFCTSLQCARENSVCIAYKEHYGIPLSEEDKELKKLYAIVNAEITKGTFANVGKEKQDG